MKYYTKFELIADDLLQNAKDNLEIDKLYKYVDLCRALDTDRLSSSKTQHNQVERCFSRLFSYEKQGKKYLITEIYNKVQPPIKTERKIRSNAPFTEWVKILIICEKTNFEDRASFTEEFDYTTNQWFFKLGMINQMYYNALQKKNIYEISNFTEKETSYFIKRVWEKFYHLLKNAFERLAARDYIYYERTYKIGENYNYLRYISREEDMLIKKCEEIACKEFKIHSIYQANDFLPHEKEKFNEFLRNLQKEYLKTSIVIKIHKVICEKRACLERKDLYPEDLNKISKDINQYVLSLVNKQAFTDIRHIDPSLNLAEKIEKKYGGYVSVDILNDPDVISNEWLLNQLLLADMFIKIKTSL